MAHPAPDGSDDFNDKIIEEFRANEGPVATEFRHVSDDAGDSCRAGPAQCRRGRSSRARQPRQVDPSLGRHLVSTIRTGQFCSYTLDTPGPIVWET